MADILLNNLAANLLSAALTATPRVTKELTEAANHVMNTAKARAPVDTGAYRDSISATVSATSAEIGPTDRNRAKVLAIEYGNSRQSPRAVMSGALDAHVEEFVVALEKLAGDI